MVGSVVDAVLKAFLQARRVSFLCGIFSGALNSAVNLFSALQFHSATGSIRRS